MNLLDRPPDSTFSDRLEGKVVNMDRNREAERLLDERLSKPTRASVDEFEETLIEDAESDADDAVDTDRMEREIKTHPERGFELRS